jgi:hypothetical protein
MSMMMPEDEMMMEGAVDPASLPIDVDPGMFSITPPELPPPPMQSVGGGMGMGSMPPMMGGGMMGGAPPAPPVQMGGGGGMMPPGTPQGYPSQTPAAPGDPGDEVLLEAFRAAAMRPR